MASIPSTVCTLNVVSADGMPAALSAMLEIGIAANLYTWFPVVPMIVNSGRIRLLTDQISWLESLEWGLFTNDIVIGPNTVFSELVEASWTGYARFASNLWYPPVSIGDTARSIAVNPGYVYNSSLSTVTYRGWFVLDPATGDLVAGQEHGEQNISPSSAWIAVPTAVVF